MTADAKCDISLILTTFNQPISDIIFSLESAVRQQGVNFEIVIADDASEDNKFGIIRDYFRTRQFDTFTLLPSDVNRRTVANIRNALEHCSGRFVKVLGAGDALYEEDTLQKVVVFMDHSGADIGIGKIFGFRETADSNYVGNRFNAPTNIDQYRADANVSNFELFKANVNNANWIPGSAQLYGRDMYHELLLTLEKDYADQYVEDFAATIALCDSNIKAIATDIPLIWYETSSGISASGTKSSIARMYKDHANFYATIGTKKPFGRRWARARTAFAVRHMISKTPAYAHFQSKLMSNYLSSPNVPVSDFFLACKAVSKRYSK